MPAEPWSAWDIAEAFHLAHAADFIVATELLDDCERSASALADEASLDPHLLARLLDLLADRTNLVNRGPVGYRKGEGMGPLDEALIHQYIGTYGPNAMALPKILATPLLGRELVDRERHARAFAKAPGAGQALLPGLLTRLGFDRVLDLGCGTGGLLIEMAQTNPRFQGYGVDVNPAMIRAAQLCRRSCEVASKRVRFRVADVTHPAQGLPEEMLKRVQAVVAASMLNELFYPDAGPAVTWLRMLRGILPARTLVVADYYGVLGHVSKPPPGRALHDWIQLISAQGIPPSDLEAWARVYTDADCTLAHAIEDPRTGVFIHLVRLAPPSK